MWLFTACPTIQAGLGQKKHSSSALSLSLLAATLGVGLLRSCTLEIVQPLRACQKLVASAVTIFVFLLVQPLVHVTQLDGLRMPAFGLERTLH